MSGTSCFYGWTCIYCYDDLGIWFAFENYTAVGCAFAIHSIDNILKRFHAITLDN